ncbi:hypothetical protein HID58_015760, partial [Brassica napus]
SDAIGDFLKTTTRLVSSLGIFVAGGFGRRNHHVLFFRQSLGFGREDHMIFERLACVFSPNGSVILRYWPPWPGDHRGLAHKLKLELKIWIQGIVLLDMAGIRYDSDDFVRTIVLVCGGSIWQQGSIQNHGKYLYFSLSSLGDSVSPKNEKWLESGNGQYEGNSVLKRRPMVILQHQHNVEYFSYCVCWFQIGKKRRSWRVKTITTHVISCSGSVWDGLRCNRWIQSNDLRKEKRLLVTMHDSQQDHLRPRTKMDKVSVSAYSTDELDSNVLLLFQFQNLLKNVLFISYVSCKHLNPF